MYLICFDLFNNIYSSSNNSTNSNTIIYFKEEEMKNLVSFAIYIFLVQGMYHLFGFEATIIFLFAFLVWVLSKIKEKLKDDTNR